MSELYAPFTRTGAPIMMMDTASAELCKYAANSILATRISFMNEIANVCELVGADVDQVRKAIGAGPADRHVVPVSRRRLRRQLLPEGRQGAAQVGRGSRLRLQDPARGRGGERPRRRSGWSTRCWRISATSTGEDDRAVGAGVQAADRRHARSAGDRDHRAAAGARARSFAPTIRRPTETARRAVRRSHHALREELRRADRRRRAGRRHRVERRSASRTSRRCGSCCGRRSCSTAATSTRPSRCGRSASPTSPLAGKRATRPGHGRRRLYRQPRGQGARRARATASSSSTTWSAGHREAVQYGELVEGDIARRRPRSREALRRTSVDAVMHFAAFLDVGESVREPVTLLSQQRRRRAERARGDGRASR